MNKTKTTIVGAGAVGGLIAASLNRAGHDVTILARAETLKVIVAEGIRIFPVDSDVEDCIKVQATDNPSVPGEQDFLIIALKAQALPAMAKRLQPLIGKSTAIVTAMNGLPWWFLNGFTGPLETHLVESVDPDGVVSQSLPSDHAIGCVVRLASYNIGPGVIKRGNGNQLIIGAASSSFATRAQALARDLEKGGFEVSTTDNIREAIWLKLWGNMNMNPISALTGSTIDVIREDPLTYMLVQRMMQEAATVGKKLGISLNISIAEHIESTRRLGAFKTSMLQDLEESRELELMPILGVFPELGRKLSVPTPFCDAVLGLLRQRAMNNKRF